MIDIKKLREQKEQYYKALARKGVSADILDKLLASEEKFREILNEVQLLSESQNKFSKSIPTLSKEEKNTALAEMKKISEEKKKKETQLEIFKTDFEKLLNRIPALPAEDAPDGETDEDNVEVKKWGTIPTFDFEPKEHWELAEKLDILDLERAAKVSGARFYYMKNELAILQRALVFWTFQEVSNKGFCPIIPPFLTKADAIRGTGYFDKDENYCVNPGEDDLYLIATSEVPLTSYFADEILEENNLPHKFVGYSPCFRREAGSYGKDTKGILRVHQFEKVEMVIFCTPEQDTEMHELIREIEEEILQKLEIPYRVVNVCTGDLGNSASKKYDLEAWLPGQGKYREMTSTSICTDFQSRRLKTRIRKKNGEIVYAHILNGTAVSSRPLIAILENFQQKDGSILIPKILQPLCGFDKITPKT